MRLLLDAGNTTISAALGDGTTLVRTARIPIERMADDRTLEDGLERALGPAGLRSGAVDAIVLATVVPRAATAVEALASRLGVRLVAVAAGTVPLAVAVAEPDRVGPDRLANAVAAARLHGTPAIVVDAGSATTWECIDADGAFVGGAIAPGLGMSLDALAERTALLPRAVIALPEAAIGADTIAAIGSGTVLGHRLLVEGLTRRIAAELAARSGVEPDVVHRILTGGYAATAWGATLEGFDARDPDLTLRGIALVGEHALGPAAPRRTEAAGSSR